MDADHTNLLIDIETILRNRMGSKSKYVPRFVFSWLKRFIHQDFINNYLKEGREGVDFCQGTLDYLGVTLEVEGLEHLAESTTQRYTFVSNHPLGAIDGVTLGAVLGKQFNGKVRYLVNDLLMSLRGLAPLCVPVNKLGRQGRNFSQQVSEAFASDNNIIMFPAGLCSRRIDGIIRDVPWHKAFVTQSKKHQRDIIPIHFIAQNSDRFYRIANLCKKLHLPNFAMALLPDEMYRAQGKHFRVIIGNPISWQSLTNEKNAQEWAQTIQAIAEKL